jgi:hypothetical protein
MQKVFERATVQFYKRDRDGTGRLPSEQVLIIRAVSLLLYCIVFAVML